MLLERTDLFRISFKSSFFLFLSFVFHNRADLLLSKTSASSPPLCRLSGWEGTLCHGWSRSGAYIRRRYVPMSVMPDRASFYFFDSGDIAIHKDDGDVSAVYVILPADNDDVAFHGYLRSCGIIHTSSMVFIKMLI